MNYSKMKKSDLVARIEELAKMIRYSVLELDDTLTSCLNAHYRSGSRYSVNGIVEKARMLNQIMLGYQG